ncbi:MAG TPA: transglutaminase-like domain-containing protein [Anaeromyxobacter sp.]|nr:transglutaminase-like domain-containing protein [Anaeromyxobacter sp.]
MPVALESRARARFAALIARDPVPLDEAVLAIAEEEYPDLDLEEVLVRLDRLGERVRARAGARDRAASILGAVRHVLVEEEGLRGNDRDYQDPRNSFLNEVLERKLGIPITLSVVWMEVARRAGLRLDGVGFPGHFLVKYVSPGGTEIFIDAFNQGELLTADECVARYRARTGGRDLDRRYLEAVGARQILARALHNLRRVYVERRDDVRAWWVLDRILMLTPGQLEALRDRGLVAARLGGAAAAQRDLEAYLARSPAAADAEDVRRVLAAVRGRRPLVN